MNLKGFFQFSHASQIKAQFQLHEENMLDALNVYTLHSELAKILIQYVNELGGAEADTIATKPKGASNKRDGQHSSDFAMMTSDIDPTDYRKSTCLSSVFAVFGSQY